MQLWTCLWLALLHALFCDRLVGMPYKLPLQGSVGGNRTLVLLEDITVGRRSYSLFFDILQQQGHQVMYGQIDAGQMTVCHCVMGNHGSSAVLLVLPMAMRHEVPAGLDTMSPASS